MKRSKTMLAVFLAPAILSYLIVFLYPTLRTVFMSLFDVGNITDAIAKWQFVGIENYKTLFGESLFKASLRNIGGIWLYGGIGVFLIAIFFSVTLTSGVKHKSFYRAVIYLPNVISAVAMGTMWIHYVFNARYGLFKTFFAFLHMNKLAAFQWTAPDNIFAALTLAYSFGMVGYFVLIFMAGIEKIPADYYEAATIEGANTWKKFSNITYPLLKDVLRTNIVLWTISIVGFFVWSQVFSPLTPDMGTVTPMVYMYQSVFGANTVVTSRNVGAGAAVGVILAAMVIISFICTNVIFKNDDLEY
ncbi:permease component of ABC-type sugar transporter [Sphaerochaeta pleomorpha str. Grapes]|uniref:Permease component of ABC-type sugar transporter n=1 Tax=Sphaerochaeta pleomorpha (strain ATCC BAA-1885 / DSM 22778 / Grapes) TaxID=158190 RepID=G8QVN0_SPHPG|nr:sugar ABC transporter permease [Sphaerochaeta pleomorpha]AEV29322.1 permease component of ABC-type sugar transporter [Sphaerochaeta pleomorpha str. Grapes]